MKMSCDTCENFSPMFCSKCEEFNFYKQRKEKEVAIDIPITPNKELPPIAFVFYNIGVDTPITPNEELPPLPKIPKDSLVIVEGKAPIWRYGMALNVLYGSPACAIAFLDPLYNAAVVVASSYKSKIKTGDIINIPTKNENEIEI